MNRYSLTSILILTLFGCGGMEPINLDHHQAAMLNGKYNPNHPVVGALFSDSGLCTGTLITPRHVLTAAHCLLDRKKNWLNKVYTQPVEGLEFSSPAGFGTVVDIKIHDDYFPYPDDVGVAEMSDVYHRRVDLGIAVLDRDLPGVRPMLLSDKAPRRDATLEVLGAGPQDVTEKYAGFIYWGNVRVQSVTDTLLQFSHLHSDVETVPGDSGGPLVVLRGTKYALAGIASFGYEEGVHFDGAALESHGLPRGKPRFAPRIDRFIGWIRQHTNNRVQVFAPNVEYPGGLGSPCEVRNEELCDSRICHIVGAGPEGFCTTYCKPANGIFCAEGWSCQHQQHLSDGVWVDRLEGECVPTNGGTNSQKGDGIDGIDERADQTVVSMGCSMGPTDDPPGALSVIFFLLVCLAITRQWALCQRSE